MSIARASLLTLALACLTETSTGAELGAPRERAYPLDSVARNAAANGTAQCRPKQLVRYRGTRIMLEPPSPVFAPFIANLKRFEETLVEVGTQVYGRAPTRMVHAGTYACRSVEPERAHWSEHAFGNAIDVTAFRFPALDPATASTVQVPASLRRAFTVSVSASYHPARPATATGQRHQLFFTKLRRALRERGLFRTMIGPLDSRHQSHLHLDMSPWPYVRL